MDTSHGDNPVEKISMRENPKANPGRQPCRENKLERQPCRENKPGRQPCKNKKINVRETTLQKKKQGGLGGWI
jgi:hypothetical protein